MEQCDLCNNLRLTKDEDTGTLVECKCVIRNRILTHLGQFLPAPSPTEETKKLVELARSNDDSFFLSKLPNEQYRPFFMLFLSEAIRKNIGFRIIKTYELIQIYLGEMEDDGFYTMTHPWLILLYGFSKMPNRREAAILGQFLDIYRNDRRVIVYSEGTSLEGGCSAAEIKAECFAKGLKSLKG